MLIFLFFAIFTSNFFYSLVFFEFLYGYFSRRIRIRQLFCRTGTGSRNLLWLDIFLNFFFQNVENFQKIILVQKFSKKVVPEKSYARKTEFSGQVRSHVCVVEIVINESCSKMGRFRIHFEDNIFHSVKLTLESEYSFHFTARAHCSFHFVYRVRTGFRCTGELRSPRSWNN